MQHQDQLNLDPRAQIALDVLEQLEKRRLIARQGIYMSVPDFANEGRASSSLRFPQRLEGASVKSAIEGKECHVCALGALFVAQVDRVNGIKTDADMGMYINDDSFMRRFLRTSSFKEDQLKLIELAFEGSAFVDQYEDSFHIGRPLYWDSVEDSVVDEEGEPVEEYVTMAVRFTRRVEDPEERMKMIMRNIIENNGEFKP